MQDRRLLVEEIEQPRSRSMLDEKSLAVEEVALAGHHQRLAFRSAPSPASTAAT
jgi:hypothetical protein